MGYGVGFEDGRWIGYAVPAECDWPDCHVMIDHGMAYRCETHWSWEYKKDGEYVEHTEDWDEEIEVEDEGCGLFFCSDHLNAEDKHEPIQPKPDHPRWLWWVLNDDSWKKWREENPDKVTAFQELTKDFVPDAELLQELEWERTN